MQVHTSHGTLQTLYRAVLALWPPKVSQRAQQRRGPLLHWPSRGAELGFGFGFGAELGFGFGVGAVPVSEIVCEAVTVC